MKRKLRRRNALCESLRELNQHFADVYYPQNREAGMLKDYVGDYESQGKFCHTPSSNIITTTI